MHPNLLEKIFVKELSLCTVLLENNKHYPWLFLVPKREGVSKMMDLSLDDQFQLMKELDLAQRALWKLFSPTQVNVAAIGNKTPQLHLHVIARFEGDPAWPGTVWDHSLAIEYSSQEKEELVKRIAAQLTQI